MSDQEFFDQDEKQDEKEDEKSREKRQRDPLNNAAWAAILIWAGVVMLLANLEILSDVNILGYRVQAWSLGFLGAGVIVLIEMVARMIIPAYRRNVGGTFIFAVVLIAVGLGEIVSWSVVGPLILIALGVSVLLGGLFRRN